MTQMSIGKAADIISMSSDASNDMQEVRDFLYSLVDIDLVKVASLLREGSFLHEEADGNYNISADDWRELADKIEKAAKPDNFYTTEEIFQKLHDHLVKEMTNPDHPIREVVRKWKLKDKDIYGSELLKPEHKIQYLLRSYMGK